MSCGGFFVRNSEQHEAIVSRGSNLLLSAAAGSGKTAVLVERIVRLVVDDKIDIDKLLIVTFTKAAAGEMRERIALKIAKELENTDKNTEYIRRQLTILNKANISTLHAFCMNVVKSHFHFIGIEPSFRMADTTESTLMKIEAIDEVLEDFYEQGDVCFLQLIEEYVEKGRKYQFPPPPVESCHNCNKLVRFGKHGFYDRYSIVETFSGYIVCRRYICLDYDK
ncbi:MAG: UvrD-helicase domain-containing protein [Alkaliphilus sp.]